MRWRERTSLSFMVARQRNQIHMYNFGFWCDAQMRNQNEKTTTQQNIRKESKKNNNNTQTKYLQQIQMTNDKFQIIQSKHFSFFSIGKTWFLHLFSA